MNIETLQEKAREYITQYPELSSDIVSFVEMAVCEIEDGESEHNECELAMQSIEELIEEHEELFDKSK